MDKETLSNYGWIIVVILIGSIMLMLATPFGKYLTANIHSPVKDTVDNAEFYKDKNKDKKQVFSVYNEGVALCNFIQLNGGKIQVKSTYLSNSKRDFTAKIIRIEIAELRIIFGIRCTKLLKANASIRKRAV